MEFQSDIIPQSRCSYWGQVRVRLEEDQVERNNWMVEFVKIIRLEVLQRVISLVGERSLKLMHLAIFSQMESQR